MIERFDQIRPAVLHPDGTTVEGQTVVDNRLLAQLVARADQCRDCPILHDGLQRQVVGAVRLAAVLRDLGLDTDDGKLAEVLAIP